MPTSSINAAGLAAVAAGGGAATAYLLDPANGRARRAELRERAAAIARRRWRSEVEDASTAATVAKDRAVGAAHEARQAAEPERTAPNDQELAHRVETVIFAPPAAPKDSVNVNAEAGIVYLRGEVADPAQVDALVDAARGVDGVRAVECFLHLPGEPAPHKRETERETRRRVEGQAPSS